MPSSWGGFGAFPKLRQLTLALNPLLGGPLPASWGSDGSSMQALQTLDMNNCNFSGGIPAQWTKTLPSLQRINISSNILTGALHGCLAVCSL